MQRNHPQYLLATANVVDKPLHQGGPDEVSTKWVGEPAELAMDVLPRAEGCLGIRQHSLGGVRSGAESLEQWRVEGLGCSNDLRAISASAFNSAKEASQGVAEQGDAAYPF